MSVSENIFNFNWGDVPAHLIQEVIAAHAAVADWALTQVGTNEVEWIDATEVEDVNDIASMPDIDAEHTVIFAADYGSWKEGDDAVIRTRVHGNGELRDACGDLLHRVGEDEAGGRDIDAVTDKACNFIARWLDTEYQG
jgi:hypothetical protein